MNTGVLTYLWSDVTSSSISKYFSSYHAICLPLLQTLISFQTSLQSNNKLLETEDIPQSSELIPLFGVACGTPYKIPQEEYDQLQKTFTQPPVLSHHTRFLSKFFFSTYSLMILIKWYKLIYSNDIFINAQITPQSYTKVTLWD